MTRLALLGASGHGKVVGDAALNAGWHEIVFYDDRWPELQSLGPWAVLGNAEDLVRARQTFDAAFVSIGDNRTRLAQQRKLVDAGVALATIVHPSAVMSRFAQVGPGSVVFAGAILNPFASAGAAVIINTGATVDHDCVLADGVHVSPGAQLGGMVRVGQASWIGIGASVRQNILIGADVIVGVGAAVVRDVADGLTVVGVPARPLRASAGA